MSLEREIIEKLHRQSLAAGDIPGLGIGDDAAFLLASSLEHDKLILSTDSLVEGVHFDPRLSSYGDVAAKLYEMNVSDIYAKGAHPRWVLLSLNLTRELAQDEEAINEFTSVLSEKLKKDGVALLGGDTTASSVNTFTMTVLGCGHEFIYRKNESIEPGDLLVVCGRLGGSSYALSQFQKGASLSQEAATAHRRPKACSDN